MSWHLVEQTARGDRRLVTELHAGPKRSDSPIEYHSVGHVLLYCLAPAATGEGPWLWLVAE